MDMNVSIARLRNLNATGLQYFLAQRTNSGWAFSLFFVFTGLDVAWVLAMMEVPLHVAQANVADLMAPS